LGASGRLHEDEAQRAKSLGRFPLMAAENAGSIYAEVRIRLDQLNADLKTATAKIDSFEKGLGDSTAATSKKVSSNFNAMSIAAVAASALIVTAFRSMLTATAQYSQAMSDVQAATRGTSADLAALEGAATSAGDALETSTTDALGAVEALAKAGVGTADIMGGALTGALTLAAAGSMDVSDAAEIAAATMTQFGLAGSDVTHIADLLAAGAGKAQGEVSDLSQALKQTGLVASQTGLSVDDTVGSLAAFASAGLLGSDAGTSFRTMLLRLNPQSKEAADEMKKLGINAFDLKGEFIGIEKFAGQLQTQLKGLTDQQRQAALTTIFGSDSIRAATVLYSQGAEGIGQWIKSVNDSGFAARTAQTKLDNLNGDLKKFEAGATDAAAATGKALTPAFRSITQAGAAFFEFVSKLDPTLLTFIGTLGLLAGGLIAVAAAGPAVVSTIIGIGTAAATALGPAGLLIAGITVLGGAAVAAGASMGLFSDKTEVSAESIKKSAEKISEAKKSIEQFGIDVTSLTYDVQLLNQKLKDLSKFDGKVLKLDIKNPKDALKIFTQIGSAIGITAEQAARAAIENANANATIKAAAKSFLESMEAARKEGAVKAETIALTDELTTALLYQDSLLKAGAKSQEDVLKTKISLYQEQIDKIEEAGAIAGKADTAAIIAAREQVALLKERLELIGGSAVDEAWATQTALLDEFTQRDADALAEQEKNEADAWATQFAFMEEFDQRDAESKKAQEERTKALVSSSLEAFSALSDALSAVFASMYASQLDDLEANYDRERELLENNGLTKKQALEKEVQDKLTAGDVTGAADAQKALDLYNLEAEFTKKKADLEYRAALTQWKFKVSAAIASAAQAIITAATGAPWPLNLPAIGFASFIGGAQVAAVSASQPQPPKFATGGLVLPSGQSGQQVTVADQGGGELMFGTGALGQPLMQGFAQMVADMVSSRGGGAGQTIVVQTILDGKVVATSTAKLIDDGVVPMRSLKR
jgi:TP901 family phage tail tape measure protein